MDSNADTSCVGLNWTPIYFTGDTVQVLPFTDSYDSLKDIPVATCATIVTTEDGARILLIASEVLFFGSSLKHSLINPNQLRMHGLKVTDDPTVTHGFGIHTDSLFIPFETKGTVIYFQSEAPSQAEIEDLRLSHITLTDDEPWDPKLVNLRPHQPSHPTPAVPFDIRYLNQVSSSTKAIRLDTHMGDVGMEHLADKSSSLATCIPHEFDRRLIQSVRVHDVDPTSVMEIDLDRNVGSVMMDKRHSEVTPESVASKFNISIETAKRTLTMTTQQGIRTAIHPLSRRYRVDRIRLNRRKLPGKWYFDILYTKTKSLEGNTCAGVLTNGYYTRVTPLSTRKNVCTCLHEMERELGTPLHLRTDLDSVLTGPGTDWASAVKEYKINVTYAEKGRKNQNHHAEREIGELKKRWRRRMTEKGVPKRMWDRGLTYEAEVLSLLSRGQGERPGIEQVTGQTWDISEYLDFEFWDLVWYYPGSGTKLDMTDEPRQLGRWIGPSHRVGSSLCYWILTAAGKLISNSTVQHVVRTDYQTPEVKTRINEFNNKMTERLSDENFQIRTESGLNYLEDDPEAKMPYKQAPPEDEYDEHWGPPVYEPQEAGDSEEVIDKYIGANIMMDLDTDPVYGVVTGRATDPSGNELGSHHRNPMLDTREYIVKLPNDTYRRYTANQIAQAMYSQVDSEGNVHQFMEEIIGHRKGDDAVTKEDGYWISKGGNKTPKRTTAGWEICIKWKTGEIEWVSLKDIKDSNPIELAEYAVRNRISDEPAFRWWVPTVIKTRQSVIGKVKKRYWATTHKFGIRLPKSVDEALELDRRTKTDYWAKAIKKEMDKVKVAWLAREDCTPQQVRDGTVEDLKAYQEIRNHLVFDVKMDFTRKARMVAGGHMTEAPGSLTYSSVVSRDSVRILLTVAAMNELDVFACDVNNAYLNAPCREKIWFVAGPECGADAGKVCVVTRALYGLKSSGASWAQMMADTLVNELGFVPSRADSDVYMREAVDPKSGAKYYEYILCYVDDILVISHRAKDVVKEIAAWFQLKDLQEPELYLGAQLGKQQLPCGNTAWYMAADKYIAGALLTLQGLYDEDGYGRKIKKAKTPFPSGYKPELDLTEELGDDMTSRFRQLVGILRWAVELGRVDFYHEVAVISQFNALPREGHLEAVYNMFDYLNDKPKAKMVFDWNLPDYQVPSDEGTDWTPFYGDVKEELPQDMPTPRGYTVQTSCFVDSNHAGNVVTRRSHTGILIFLNKAPVIWYSKRQNTVEASTFGSEFVAKRLAKEMIVAFRYKLRMFGIPIDGPTLIFGDNEGVVKNTSIPESVLHKKHLSIAYHSVREAAAAGIVRVVKENTATNLSDLFTKCLPRARRDFLLSRILWGPWFDADQNPELVNSRKRRAEAMKD